MRIKVCVKLTLQSLQYSEGNQQSTVLRTHLGALLSSRSSFPAVPAFALNAKWVAGDDMAEGCMRTCVKHSSAVPELV